jgi:hypothetical protein
MKRCIFSIVFFCFSGLLFSQKAYFQQEVNYTIKVELNDKDNLLYGAEDLTYTNNSPDTLYFIYFHLWPNAYKNTKTAFAQQVLEDKSTDFYFAPKEKKGFIDSLNFKVNNKSGRFEYDKDHQDICKVFLDEPLFPGSTVQISTPFRVKMPGDFSRFGHVGQSYQVTQWYPKPAVYDRDGWHQMPYLESGEFYSEYGSYDVKITLPENYVVGATGQLQNKDETQWLNDIATKTVKRSGFDRKNLAFPVSSDNKKTLNYKINNVHDFAWFADKRYHVLKDSVKLPQSGNWVTTFTMFTNEYGNVWMNSQEYIKDALTYYSEWYGDYPYRTCTAVQGAISAGGAMEYPTITVVGPAQNGFMLEQFIMHEVGHNWFYGVLGFNERRYPFLDEGINSFSEFRYFNEKYKREKMLYEMIVPYKIARFLNIEDIPYSEYYSLTALFPQSYNVDQPINTRSSKLSQINYGSIIYDKTALSFYYLYNYLGHDTFNMVMRDFYQEWKFKHPLPTDLKNTFVAHTNKNLDWFFGDLIGTTKKIDYKIVKAKDNQVLIKNTGDIPSPVALSGISSGEENYTIWSEGFVGKKWVNVPTLEVDKVVLNPFDLPELNKQNNTIRTHGVLKKVEPLEIDKFQIVEKPEKTQIGVLPAFAWNNYNKFMLGVFFYNPAIPLPKVEYQLVPMYGFGNNQLAGIGQVVWHTFPKNSFTERLDFMVSGRRFGNSPIASASSYNKFTGAMALYFKSKNYRSKSLNKLKLSYTSINDFSIADYDLVDLTFRHDNRQYFNPYSFNISVQNIQSAFRLFSGINYNVSIKKTRKAIQFRVFGGLELVEHALPFYLSGGPAADQSLKDLYLGRSDAYVQPSLWARQTSVSQGNFYAYTPVSSDFILTGQAKVKIPYVPFYAYGSVGTFHNQYQGYKFDTPDNILFESGFNLSFPGIIDVYFPLVNSKETDEYLDLATSNYWQKIRFCIYLKNLNLFKYRDQYAHD